MGNHRSRVLGISAIAAHLLVRAFRTENGDLRTHTTNRVHNRSTLIVSVLRPIGGSSRLTQQEYKLLPRQI
jgi:hypothetical protein